MADSKDGGLRIGSVIIEKQKGGKKDRHNIYNNKTVVRQSVRENPKKTGGCSSCRQKKKLK